MKNINFLLLVIAIVMTSSCADTYDTSYSVEQMNCFVATAIRCSVSEPAFKPLMIERVGLYISNTYSFYLLNKK